jgi:multicomponent Na+:H+ antiporter subunit E
MSSTTRFINLWVTLEALWLIANASLAMDVVLVGAVISGALGFLFRDFGRVYGDIRWSPKVIYNYVLYFGVFLRELVKANFNVMRVVFSPTIDIKPGIVEIRTRLRSPLGRLTLANSITLTPGTLVVDMHEDSLFIHWINVTAKDPQAATQEIAGSFEKYLEVIYG